MFQKVKKYIYILYIHTYTYIYTYIYIYIYIGINLFRELFLMDHLIDKDKLLNSLKINSLYDEMDIVKIKEFELKYKQKVF